MGKVNLDIPIIFYWIDEQDSVMTAAFKWKGENFGLSYLFSSDVKANNINKNKLLFQVGTTLDVLLHHGRKVVNSKGDVDSEMVDNEEAKRFWLDQDWAKQVAFINKMMQTKDITKEYAKKLGLL